MKQQAFNPYLPSYEYIPDGEPHLFDDRIYVYGSHDKFNGASFCLNDYVCWSAPKDDLSDWRYEGVIYRRKQDPYGKDGIMSAMYAPDVCRGTDGRYYLYYFIGYNGVISVAVCDTPAGKYEFLDFVRYKDGTVVGKKGEPLQFDPGVFVDDDGKVYMYTGFGPVGYPSFLMKGHKPSRKGAMVFELESDMLTVKGDYKYIGVEGKKSGAGTPYEGHEFFEASSMRKFDGKYYFIYSSFVGHELCWAVSDNPLGGFTYGGVLVSNGDVGTGGREGKNSAVNYIGNTHGSVVKANGKYYVFYHRQTNRNQFSRQACAEEIRFEDGKFFQAELTSCGLNGAPLKGEGKYEARIACHLYSKKGTYFYGVFKRPKGVHPFFTQSGVDREDNPDQYIANVRDGATAVFRYFKLNGANKIRITYRGGGGKMIVSALEDGEIAAEISLPKSSSETTAEGAFSAQDGIKPLYFRYAGGGAIDFIAFELVKE